MMCLIRRKNRKYVAMLALCTSLLAPLPNDAVAQSSWGNPLKVFIPNVSSLTGPMPTLFLAKEFDYDPEKLRVTVKGRVEIEQGDYIVRADQIDYDQKTGAVKAKGNVVILDPSGRVNFYESRDIKGKVKEGIVNSFKNKLEDNKTFIAAEERRFATKKKKTVTVAAKNPSINNGNSVVSQTLGKLVAEVQYNPASYADLAPSAGSDMTPSAQPQQTAQIPSAAPEPIAEIAPVSPPPDKNTLAQINPVIGNVPLINIPDEKQVLIPEAPVPPITPENPVNPLPVVDTQQLVATEPKPAAIEPNLFDALNDKNMMGDDTTIDLKKIITPVDPEMLKPKAVEPAPENKLAQPEDKKEEKIEAPKEMAAKKPEDKKPKKTEIAKAKPKALALPVKTIEDKKLEADPSEPADTLSPESRAILDKVAPRAIKPAPAKAERSFKVNHTRDMQDLFKADEMPSAPENSMGIKVETKMPRINIDYELDKAYNSINSGNSDVAIETYQRILDNDPDNTQALFGLATLYHRARQFDLARPVYSRLLTVSPKHRDGFNNFLVMLADEAPNEALTELEKLEARNPGFSTIPAQIAVIHQKLGQPEKAIDKMFRAVALAPENLIYRYNLAIMLDKQKNYDEAAKLYRQLLEAVARGEKIPGNIENIQQRLTFISSNR